MKIILTGSESHLVNKLQRELLNQGYDVQLFPIRGNSWNENLIEKNDVVIHIAGVTPKKGITTDLFYEVNHQKTKKLVSICQERKIAHFIYISTMAVYGEQLRKIGDNPIGIDTPCDYPAHYGNSKLLAENEVRSFPAAIKWTILRVPSLYDEVRQEYFDVFYNFARRVPIIPRFTFNTRRTLLSIDNLCSLLSAVICNQDDRFTNFILLPSDNCEYDVNRLFAKICTDCGMKKCSINVGLKLAKLLSRYFPFFLSFSLNAYYCDADAVKVPGKSIFDYQYLWRK